MENVKPVRAPAQRPKFSTAVLVRGGFVWEHDVDANGVATGELRPHYKKGDHGWPPSGYPELKDLPRIEAETAARDLAAKKG